MMSIKQALLWAAVGFVSVSTAVQPIRMIESRARRNTISGSHPWLKDTDLTHAAATDLSHLYPARTLSVPIDHFHNDTLYEPHTNATFDLRYFFDATYFKPGGPVIVLQAGETSAVGRLPYLQKGILHDLIVATHGIGVVIEHRYYGKSLPTSNFSTESLRFLTTDQALADQVYFAKHVKFAGLEDQKLNAPDVPYLAYGGSYAGGFSAFIRKLYPDVFWGAISSSGVTQAIHKYWVYFEPIRVYGPSECISYTQKITNAVDNILSQNNAKLTSQLKTAWNLPNVTYDDDFAGALALGVEMWQGRNWDPAIGSPYFDYYCDALTSKALIEPEIPELTTTIRHLLSKGGYSSEVDTLAIPMLNWITWLTRTFVQHCPVNQDLCFGTHDTTFYHQDDIFQEWRAWPYQYCTQWGYLQYSHTPSPSILPIISRYLTLDRESEICRQAFNITSPPNVTAINKWGGFNISYPRLAIVDGEQDPWRGATPHASPFDYDEPVGNRTNSVDEPWYLMAGAVHHWDENGLSREDRQAGKRVPEAVERVQREEVKFVKEWMREWERKENAERFEL